MLYDPKNPIDRERATRRMNEFFQKGQVFDLTGKNPKRTIRQNSYLHLILGYFAVETGYTIEWVKEKYVKIFTTSIIRFITEKFIVFHPVKYILVTKFLEILFFEALFSLETIPHSANIRIRT